MAKAKNTFLKSKMNKDLDARILPQGEYRDAQNVQVSRSDGSTTGALENILGNKKVQDFKTLTGVSNLFCIGQKVDDNNSTVYLFLTDHVGSAYSTTANNFIFSYNAQSDTSIMLVKGAFLNFSQINPIYGVNVLENLLFWTDNRNQPRKINIISANTNPNSTNPTYYTTEDQISVAKYNPYSAIELYAGLNPSSNVYETTMKDVVSINLPNGGTALATATVTGTDHVIDGVTGDIVVANGTYNATGSPVALRSISLPYTVVDTGATVSTYNNGSGVLVLSSSVTIADNQMIVFNANPYYNSQFAGDPNYLEDKFVRFGYRFQYDDNEYSIFSPFTQTTFIPKQDGYFMRVDKPGLAKVEDQGDTYRSTLVSFVENKVNSIKLRIPLPYPNYTLASNLKIINLDILYKESDELAVKVVDTVSMATINAQAGICDVNGAITGSATVVVNNIQGGVKVGEYVRGLGIVGSPTVAAFEATNPQQAVPTSGTITLSAVQTLANDVVLTLGEPNFYIYDYQSKKPFKTLPSKELIRVYDKTPVRALAQEVSGNRVIYGNFQDKHTPPASIDYNVAVTAKNTFDLKEGFATVSSQVSGTVIDLSKTYIFVLVGSLVSGVGVPANTFVISVTGTQVTFNQSVTVTVNELLFFTPAGNVENYTSITEYPNSSLKTNRNYQIGVVLSDRFGRQSSTILSNNFNTITVGAKTFAGSTLYSPYIPSSTDPDEWPGDSIKMLFNTVFGESNNPTTGEPGIYNGDSTSIKYNPLGWYSYKIVVKQTEQEYYNVYLPGIMAAYPEDQTLEIGVTSHTVLINDNINKVPRDLSEVGPTQRQFRSSVELFGRVQNSSEAITSVNYGESNEQYFPGRTFDTVSSIATLFDLFDYDPLTPPQPNFFTQFYTLESNPYVARISTAKKIGQISNTNITAVSGTAAITGTFDSLPLVNVIGVDANIVVGDIVTGPGLPEDLLVVSPGFTTGAPLTNPVRTVTASSTGTTIGLSSKLELALGMGVSGVGVPENTVISAINPSSIEISVSNVSSVVLGAEITFVNFSTLKVATSVPITIGDVISVTQGVGTPGIQQLAVYETKPVESLLDIFWETTTSGIVSELNSAIIQQSGGAAGLNGFNDAPFTEGLPQGVGVPLVYPNVTQSPFYLVDSFGVTIPSADIDAGGELALFQVTNGFNVDVTSYFDLVETGVNTFQYNLKTTSVWEDNVYYGPEIELRTFQVVMKAQVNGQNITINENLNLGNENPIIYSIVPFSIAACPINLSITNGTTTRAVCTLGGSNGSGGTNPIVAGTIKSRLRGLGLSFEIVSQKDNNGVDVEYYGLEDPTEGDTGSSVKLVNLGFDDPTMPALIYTIKVKLSDAGSSVECDIIVDTGVPVSDFQEWTLNGSYSLSAAEPNTPNGAFRATVFVLKVSILPSSGFNGLYAFIPSNGDVVPPRNNWFGTTGQNAGGAGAGPWNELLSQNGAAAAIQIPGSDILNPSPQPTNPCFGPCAGLNSTNPNYYCNWRKISIGTVADLLNGIENSNWIPGLVFNGPNAPVWTQTAGSPLAPLNPSPDGYTFNIQDCSSGDCC